MCAYSESEVGRFQSSEGFSQATPTCGASPRLILLPFGGIPNSPGSKENASGVPCGFESHRGNEHSRRVCAIGHGCYQMHASKHDFMLAVYCQRKAEEAQLSKTGVGVEKVTVIGRLNGSRSVVKGRNPCHALLNHHSRRRAHHDGATRSFGSAVLLLPPGRSGS